MMSLIMLYFIMVCQFIMHLVERLPPLPPKTKTTTMATTKIDEIVENETSCYKIIPDMFLLSLGRL